MTRKSSHVIQSGPNKGKTVGEVRRLKRAQKTGKQPGVPKVPGGGRGRRGYRGPLQLYRPRDPSGAVAMLEKVAHDMAGVSLKPKEAVGFFNSIPGLTEAGRKYLLAMTHPNNEELRSFQGIPDSMPDEFNPYVTIDDSITITWDATAFANPPPDTVRNFNIHLFFPPIPEIQCLYYLSYPDGSTFVASYVMVVRNPAFRVASSVTVSSGTIIRTFNTLKDIGYASHRRAGMGRTVIPICSSLNNQGNIVAGQLPDLITWSDVDGAFTGPATMIGLTGSTISADIAPTEEISVFKHATIVLPSAVELTQLDKKCMDGEFRNGAYIPLVPSEPVDTLKKRVSVYSGNSDIPIAKSTDGSLIPNYFVVASNSFLSVVSRDSGSGLLVNRAFHNSSSLQVTKNANDHLFTPVVESGNQTISVLDPTKLHPGVSEPADMLTGFCYIAGLPLGADNGIQTPAVKIRTTDYSELYPINTASDIAVYRMEHPLRDQHALNVATHISQVMAHALPADDNAFNGILGKIWNVISKFVKPAAKAASFLPIPYAGTIGNLVAEGIDAVDNIANAGQI